MIILLNTANPMDGWRTHRWFLIPKKTYPRSWASCFSRLAWLDFKNKFWATRLHPGQFILNPKMEFGKMICLVIRWHKHTQATASLAQYMFRDKSRLIKRHATNHFNSDPTIITSYYIIMSHVFHHVDLLQFISRHIKQYQITSCPYI